MGMTSVQTFIHYCHIHIIFIHSLLHKIHHLLVVVTACLMFKPDLPVFNTFVHILYCKLLQSYTVYFSHLRNHPICPLLVREGISFAPTYVGECRIAKSSGYNSYDSDIVVLTMISN